MSSSPAAFGQNKHHVKVSNHSHTMKCIEKMLYEKRYIINLAFNMESSDISDKLGVDVNSPEYDSIIERAYFLHKTNNKLRPYEFIEMDYGCILDERVKLYEDEIPSIDDINDAVKYCIDNDEYDLLHHFSCNFVISEITNIYAHTQHPEIVKKERLDNIESVIKNSFVSADNKKMISDNKEYFAEAFMETFGINIK